MKLLRTTFTAVLALMLVATPVARADDSETLRALLKEIQEKLDEEQSKTRPDRERVKWLEGLLERHKPGESGGEGWGDGPSKRGGRELSRFVRGALDRVLEDVELAADEVDPTEEIVIDWYMSRRIVHDHGKDRASEREIDDDRDNRLRRLLGPRRSKDLIDALDRAARQLFRDWGRNRGR